MENDRPMVTRRYKMLRIPISAYIKLKEKQTKIQQDLQKQTGMNIPVSLARLMDIMASQTFYPDVPLVTFGRRRRRMGGYGMMPKHANKKGQGMEFAIALFIMMVAMIIILAPFLLRAVRDITSGLGTNIAELSPVGNISMQHVSTTTSNLWDFGMILGFIILTIVLFISAFMVDIHPLFIIVYLILAFILFMIVPALNDTFVEIYDSPALYNETSKLPLTNYLGSHFGIIAFIIYIITGVIMFGKMRMRSQSYG